MQKEVNKGKMLGELLKSSKTTAELARELGYVNTKGIARYNVINKDLKSLEENGYIKSERIKLEHKPGSIPTLYSIIFDFQNLRNILEEYPYLIGNMQKSDLALELILSEHLNLLDISKKDECGEQSEDVKLLIEKDKENLKKKLQSSAEFFKIFVMNDKNELTNRIQKLVQRSRELVRREFIAKKDDSDNSVPREKTIAGIDIVFKACINIDIMRGYSNTKTEEYVTKIENEVLDEPKTA